MSGHVCSWWGGYFIDNPLRRLFHNPEKILDPYVQPGMTVVDVGCGMGCSRLRRRRSSGTAASSSPSICSRKCSTWRNTGAAAGVAYRIEFHKCEQDRLGVDAQADFALAFMMIHEVPDQRRLLCEIRACLKPGGKLLVAEPKMHVPGKRFTAEVAIAAEVGLRPVETPQVNGCRAVVLEKAAKHAGDRHDDVLEQLTARWRTCRRSL